MKKLLLMGLLISTPVFAQTTLPEFQGGVDANAVWTSSDTLQKSCMNVNPPSDYLSCMISGMQKAKASPQAIAMMKYSNGNIIDYKKMGSVTVLRVGVLAADHSEAFYIVNDNGDIFDIDDSSILSSIDISRSPNYQSLLQKYPSISIWPGNHQYPTENDLPGGITQLVFTYSILNGCMACELAGIAKIGFNFDSNGSLMSTQLMSLDPPPVKISQ